MCGVQDMAGPLLIALMLGGAKHGPFSAGIP